MHQSLLGLGELVLLLRLVLAGQRKFVALNGDPFECVNYEHPTNGYDDSQKEAEK